MCVWPLHAMPLLLKWLRKLVKKKMSVIQSPNILAQSWLNVARDKNTPSEQFRSALVNVASVLFLEAISDIKGITLKKHIKTPLKKTEAYFIDEKNIVIVPILRAGLSMVPGIKQLVPEAKVAHVGLYRNEKTLQPHWYLDKLPKKISKKSTFVVLEPMLATGGTLTTVLQKIINLGVVKICVISAIISEQAKKKLEDKFPLVSIYVAGIDPNLNSQGYIVPGLGDAGDRAFNL